MVEHRTETGENVTGKCNPGKPSGLVGMRPGISSQFHFRLLGGRNETETEVIHVFRK